MSIVSQLLAGGVEGALDGIGSLFIKVRSAITGEMSPDKKAEVERLLLEIDFALKKTQTEINLVEAKHPNIFVSGWRPFIGWVCGVAIAYNFILNPLIVWGVELAGAQVTPPTLDFAPLMTLVLSLLGLGTMRSYEKMKGVNGKH
jgi:hypothetical protein